VPAAAQQWGYTPHHLAQALRRQPSRIIGFVPRWDRVSPYEMPIPYLLLSPLTSVTQPLTAVAKEAMIG
jgi:hypothetical protein